MSYQQGGAPRRSAPSRADLAKAQFATRPPIDSAKMQFIIGELAAHGPLADTMAAVIQERGVEQVLGDSKSNVHRFLRQVLDDVAQRYSQIGYARTSSFSEVLREFLVKGRNDDINAQVENQGLARLRAHIHDLYVEESTQLMQKFASRRKTPALSIAGLGRETYDGWGLGTANGAVFTESTAFRRECVDAKGRLTVLYHWAALAGQEVLNKRAVNFLRDFGTVVLNIEDDPQRSGSAGTTATFLTAEQRMSGKQSSAERWECDVEHGAIVDAVRGMMATEQRKVLDDFLRAAISPEAVVFESAVTKDGWDCDTTAAVMESAKSLIAGLRCIGGAHVRRVVESLELIDRELLDKIDSYAHSSTDWASESLFPTSPRPTAPAPKFGQPTEVQWLYLSARNVEAMLFECYRMGADDFNPAQHAEAIVDLGCRTVSKVLMDSCVGLISPRMSGSATYEQISAPMSEGELSQARVARIRAYEIYESARREYERASAVDFYFRAAAPELRDERSAKVVLGRMREMLNSPSDECVISAMKICLFCDDYRSQCRNLVVEVIADQVANLNAKRERATCVSAPLSYLMWNVGYQEACNLAVDVLSTIPLGEYFSQLAADISRADVDPGIVLKQMRYEKSDLFLRGLDASDFQCVTFADTIRGITHRSPKSRDQRGDFRIFVEMMCDVPSCTQNVLFAIQEVVAHDSCTELDRRALVDVLLACTSVRMFDGECEAYVVQRFPWWQELVRLRSAQERLGTGSASRSA